MSRQQRAFLLRDQDTMEEGSGVYLREDRDEREQKSRCFTTTNELCVDISMQGSEVSE